MARKVDFLLLTLTLIGCGPSAIAPEPQTSGDSTPDFGGHWARYSLEFEEPAQGPGPIQIMIRNPDGTPVEGKVGDYTNPILKPEAADRLKAFGDIAKKGIVFPDPENQCMPW